MPKIFCIQHLEQYYRESRMPYKRFLWLIEVGLVKLSEEFDCEHCIMGVPIFGYSTKANLLHTHIISSAYPKKQSV